MIHFAPGDGCLDLQQTLDCGQAFRWQKIDTPGGEAWRGTAFSHTLTVRAADGAFLFDCTQAEFDRIWYPYFDFGTDYAEIRRALSGLHPVLRDAAAYAPGIRILRQEPWEALCSFIISQNKEDEIKSFPFSSSARTTTSRASRAFWSACARCSARKSRAAAARSRRPSASPPARPKRSRRCVRASAQST